MKRWHLAAIVIVAIVVLSVAVWAVYVDYLNAMRHETNRWAVIEDTNGDKIVVEPISDHTWSELVQLNQNGARM